MGIRLRPGIAVRRYALLAPLGAPLRRAADPPPDFRSVALISGWAVSTKTSPRSFSGRSMDAARLAAPRPTRFPTRLQGPVASTPPARPPMQGVGAVERRVARGVLAPL
jgi:hypothetical protein